MFLRCGLHAVEGLVLEEETGPESTKGIFGGGGVGSMQLL